MPSIRAACFFGAIALASVAAADQVRWINPSGGSFGNGANWDAGHAPLATDIAVFDLNATYSVTLDANRSVQDVLIGGGTVTFELSEHELNTQSITCTLGAARVNNGVVHGRVSANGGTVTVLPSAEFDRGGSAGNNGQLFIGGTVGKQGDGAGFFSVGTGSFVRLDSTGVISSRSLTVNGTLRLEAGFVNAEVMLVNGTLYMDGGHIQGENGPLLQPGSTSHMFNGAAIAASTGAEVGGNLLIEGVGTTAGVHRVTGVMRLSSGAEAHPASGEMSAAENGRVEVGPGGTLSGRFYRMDNGVLRLEHGSVGPAGGFESFGMYANTGLELVIDAGAAPRFAARAFSPQAMQFDSELAGSLTLEVTGSNALRVGDEITLLTAANPVINGAFVTVESPVLPGGRLLEVHVQPSQVLLRVVADEGNVCWGSDFDGDGNFGTDQDIEAFFACLGGRCCTTCAEADFNGDGDTGTDQDIEAFFRVLGGASC